MIGHGVACYGAADRYLGMLAAMLGDATCGRGHFEAALATNRRIGARPGSPTPRSRTGGCCPSQATASAATALLGRGGRDRRALRPARAARAHRLARAGRAARRLPDDLSEREAEVLRQVARGLSNREIGAALFISEHTAANHVRSILRKTGAANRTEATAYAYRHGLVAP